MTDSRAPAAVTVLGPKLKESPAQPARKPKRAADTYGAGGDSDRAEPLRAHTAADSGAEHSWPDCACCSPCLGGSTGSVAVGQRQALPAPRAPALSKEWGWQSLLDTGCVNHPCIPTSPHSRAHPRVPPALPRSGRPPHLTWPGHADIRTLTPQRPAVVAPVTAL